MRGRGWNRARSALALTSGATAITLALGVVVFPPPGPIGALFEVFVLGTVVLIVIGLAAVGTLIAVRRPAHPIGWLFLGASLLISLVPAQGLLTSWQRLDGGPIPTVLLWTAGWSDTLSIGLLLIFAPLLYPTGALPSPRWRAVALPAILDIGAVSIAKALRSGLMEGPGVPNPFGIPSATALLDTMEQAGAIGLLFVVVGVVASIVVRYRHASPIERPQLKWFVYPAAVAAVAFAIATFELGLITNIAFLAGITASVLVPPAMGIAILRYHVFEIDRIVSRTLTYGLLSALLAGIYLAGVLVLRTILSPFGEGDSPVAVAGSTLVAAVLMQPLRGRLKRIVDRRFNRSRLDAERTIELFRTRIRDDTDFDRIAEGLAGTVVQALSPSSVSVWLRAPLRAP
jgi:hypothetical protein